MTTTPGQSLGRRFERRILRIQGRLDSENADRVLPWMYAIGAALVFALLSGARIRSLDGGSGLAPWLQAAWRRGHGGAGHPMTGTDPARATWSLVSEVVLWVCRIVPAETVFVVTQSVAMGLAIVPLWRLARRHAMLRVGASSVVVVAFVLAPALHRAVLGTFHPELLAVPALVAAYERSTRDQWVRFALLATFAVLCRADLGLTVAAMGVLVAVSGRRAPGVAAAVAGLTWTVAAKLATAHALPHEALTPAGEFVARSTLPLAVAPNVITHPWNTLRDLAAEPSVMFLVVVLSPLLFLPLLAPRRAVVAAPSLVLAMVADRIVQRSAGRGVFDLSPAAAHIGPAMAFVFIALVYALARIGRKSITRVNVDRRVLFALATGVLLLFVTESPASPYRNPWSWGGRDEVDAARLRAASSVGADEAVAASPQVSALVAGRATVIEIPPNPRTLGPPRIDRVAAAVDVVVVDTTVETDDNGLPVWTEPRREFVVDEFGTHGFVVASRDHDVFVLRRG